MTKFFLRWVINCLAIYAAVHLPGVFWGNDWVSILVLGLILVFVNALVRPLAKFIGCLPNMITLGLFTLVINAFLFWLTGVIGQMFNMGYTVENPWWALLGGLVVSAVSIVMSMILRDELKGKKK